MRSLAAVTLALLSTLGSAQLQTRMWLRTAVRPVHEFTALKIDSNGNAFVAGRWSESLHSGIAVTKYSPIGGFLWHRELEHGTLLKDIEVDPAGNVYAFGSASDGAGFIAKISGSGQLLWTHKTADRLVNWNGAVADGQGEITVTGWRINEQTGFGIVKTAHLSINGILEWEHEYSHPNYLPIGPQEGLTAVSLGSETLVNAYCQIAGFEADTVLLRYSSEGALLQSRIVKTGMSGTRSLLQRTKTGKILFAYVPTSTATLVRKGRVETLDSTGSTIDLTEFDFKFSVGTLLFHSISDLGNGQFAFTGQTPYRDKFFRLIYAPFAARSAGLSTVLINTIPGRVVSGYKGEIYFSGTINGLDGPPHSALTSGILSKSLAWEERVWGAHLNGNGEAVARSNVIAIDHKGDVLIAGSASRVDAVRGFIAKYRCNPVALPDHFETQVGTLLSVPSPGLLSNDLQTKAATAAIVTPPQNGQITLNSDGSFHYMPNAGFAGTDFIQYRARRDDASSASTLSVRVHADITYCRFTPTIIRAGQTATIRVQLSAPSADAIAVPYSGDFGDGVMVFPGGNAWSAKAFITPWQWVTVVYTVTVKSGTSTRTASITVTP